MEALTLFLASAAPIWIPLLALLALWGIKKLADKVGWKRSAQMDAAIDAIVKKGVAYAEAKAAEYVKEQGKKPTSEDKKTQAFAVILTELEAAGITKVATDAISSKIEEVVKKTT